MYIVVWSFCFMEYKCKRCSKEFETWNSLRKHVSRVHKVNSADFYVEYYLSGVWPVCKCGCGRKVNWNSANGTFRELCKGHYSKIHNNWGHNRKAIEKSSETRRKQFECGVRTVWNDGLTKESDERVKNNGIQSSIGINSNLNEIKNSSDRMRRCRLDGTVPTLYGINSSQWKGGVSEINNIARSSKKLYDEWKYPILIRDGFKCVKCGNVENLHIHHDKETMSEIVKKHIVDEEPKEFELKKLIAEKIVNYHIENKVSGVTLCGKCHGELHPSLNFV